MSSPGLGKKVVYCSIYDVDLYIATYYQADLCKKKTPFDHFWENQKIIHQPGFS